MIDLFQAECVCEWKSAITSSVARMMELATEHSLEFLDHKVECKQLIPNSEEGI
jgi:hypothetical protein